MNTTADSSATSGSVARAEDSASVALLPNSRLSRTTLFWILQCSGWIAFGLPMFAWALDYFSARDALINKSLLVLTGFGITLLFRFVYRKAHRRSIRPAGSAFLIFATSAIGAAVWRETHTLLFEATCSLLATGKLTAVLVKIPLGTLLYDGFVLLAWSLLYYGFNDWMELETQRERAMKAESTAHAARLRALQSQLEPHFLFNTLNSISTLVVEGKNAEANRVISRLGDFLRLTLDAADTPEISVAEELEFVRHYLELEQIRFGSRLRVTIDAQADTLRALVPVLVLQPLVENAVKHGVLPRERGGAVSVAISKNAGSLHLSVTDDGAGLVNHSRNAGGVGLSNTAARLRELYGDFARLTLDRSPAGGVAALIEIPFHTAEPKFARAVAQGFFQ